MNIHLLSIGRLGNSSESDLVNRYALRIQKIAPALGFRHFKSVELPESRYRETKRRKDDEAINLLKSMSENSFVIACDETGKNLTSVKLATQMGKQRDDGVASCAFILGGPDGHGQELLKRADMLLSFGSLTWPHALARVMAVEQIYRALTILANHPYHRD